ncbi:MAG TPA: hypothetical protein VK890_07155 [Bacteroidia bacterium]|jgi:hypothetical protein|nr:hypothetical protein [Bacteroidia bacterium]
MKNIIKLFSGFTWVIFIALIVLIIVIKMCFPKLLGDIMLDKSNAHDTNTTVPVEQH